MQRNYRADTTRKHPLFAPRRPQAGGSQGMGDKPETDNWQLLVADDDASMHEVTRLLLRGFEFEGRGVDILDAYSGAEAVELLQANPNCAVLLLDVVMEADDAGLQVIQQVREELQNHYVRIILRTGQPGQAPESEVVARYDINDYREKSELTAQRLYSCLIAALRSYRDIRKVEQLALSKESLEQRVLERTREISAINEQLQTEMAQRVAANQALQKSQAHLAEAQQLASIGSWEQDLCSGKVSWSAQMYRILEVENAGAVRPGVLLGYVPEPDKSRLAAAKQEVLNGRCFDLEHRLLTCSGAERYVRHKGELLRAADGTPLKVSCVLQDITEFRQTQSQMQKFASAIEQIADSVMITDVEGTIEYVNKAFESMTGWSSQEVLGRSSNLLKSERQQPEFYRQMWQTIKAGKAFNDIFINRKKSGELYHEVKTITPLLNTSGEITHFISSAKDITERMLDQQRLEHMAHHDALTGLPNRLLLKGRLEQLLSRKAWNDRTIAVMFLDLDRFKNINDTLGHDVGDALLCEVANRLQACVREGDTVARLGGDEFAIVLSDIARQQDIDWLAKKIISSLQQPVEIRGNQLHATTSIGISHCPGDADTVEGMLKHADVALYKAKAMGRNTFQHYSEADRFRAANRFRVETCLREALEREEFMLHYQPLLQLDNTRVTGSEALLRCNSLLLQKVSPAHFIPVLEDTGLILPVGAWVMRKACLDARQLIDAGCQDYSVSVNLSIRQFLDKSLLQTIRSVLDESGLEPWRLQLEITENLLIEHVVETTSILEKIHEMGVRLSIDDFGTGYSSLSYLKRLPLHTLKIDRSFIREVTSNEDDAAITTAIIDLSHTLGLKVIAEGVETTAQLEFLRNNRCDSIQGFLISPPVPLAQLQGQVGQAFCLESAVLREDDVGIPENQDLGL